MAQLLASVILFAAQLGPWHVGSERPDAAQSIPSLVAVLPHAIVQKQDPIALVETSDKPKQDDTVSASLAASAETAGASKAQLQDDDEPPEALQYNSYLEQSHALTQKLEHLHDHVTSTVDELAHDAVMKSAKYGYGLDGIRHNIMDMKKSVGRYKNSMRTLFRDQTDEFHETLQAGQLWENEDFKKIPEGELWHAPMLEALSEERADDLNPGQGSKFRRMALTANLGEAQSNEYIHPQVTNVYKMGYSHGYKNASGGEKHGVEEMLTPTEVEPMAYAWTHQGVKNYGQYFTGKDAAKVPKEHSFLTKEQQDIIDEAVDEFDPDKLVERGNMLKEMDDDVLPYTWTMNGHLWCLENGIFDGPPPSVHSWVSKKMLDNIDKFGRNVPNGPDHSIGHETAELTKWVEAHAVVGDAATGLFRKQEVDEAGKPKPLDVDDAVRDRERDASAMPAGYEHLLGKDLGEDKSKPEEDADAKLAAEVGARPAMPDME